MDKQWTEIVEVLRNSNPYLYAFSLEAGEELSRNDHMGATYGSEMWEEFYGELENEFLESRNYWESSND